MYNEDLDQSVLTHMVVHGICRSTIQSEHTRTTMVESNMLCSADQGLYMYIDRKYENILHGVQLILFLRS